MKYRKLLLIIIIISVILIVFEYGRSSVQCKKDTSTYKYIPRTLQEEQEEPFKVYDIFRTMFLQPSPWVSSSKQFKVERHGKINKFHISQM